MNKTEILAVTGALVVMAVMGIGISFIHYGHLISDSIQVTHVSAQSQSAPPDDNP